MLVKVKIEDIQWDTDGVSPDEIGLPANTEVTVDVTGRLRADEIKPNFSEMTRDAARVLDELVCDALSDMSGYCVNGGSRYPKDAISPARTPAIALSGKLTTLPENLRPKGDNLDLGDAHRLTSMPETLPVIDVDLDLSAIPEPDEDTSPAP